MKVVYKVFVRAARLMPCTSPTTLEWNEVGSRSTLKAALGLFDSWVKSFGYDHDVEMYSVPYDGKHRFYAAGCRQEKQIEENS